MNAIAQAIEESHLERLVSAAKSKNQGVELSNNRSGSSGNGAVQNHYCEEFRLLPLVDTLKSSFFFLGVGTPWLIYSRVCPGVT